MRKVRTVEEKNTHDESRRQDEDQKWTSDEKVSRVPLKNTEKQINKTEKIRPCTACLMKNGRKSEDAINHLDISVELTGSLMADRTALRTDTTSVLFVKWDRPRRPLSCWNPMTMAAPPTKPTRVAWERKSTRKPNLKFKWRSWTPEFLPKILGWSFVIQ